MSKPYDDNRKPTGHHKRYQLVEEDPKKVATCIFGTDPTTFSPEKGGQREC
jgi:hypothetical protein